MPNRGKLLNQMHRRIILSTVLLLALALPRAVSAQATEIQPQRVDSSQTVEDALQKNPGHASTVLEGKGSSLLLDYVSNEPITVFLVPLFDGNNYSITDFLSFTLPETDNGSVSVDLTASPGWSQGNRRYLLNLLSASEEPGLAISKYEFLPASAGQTLGAMVHHFFIPELYTPSSFHALRGYRVLGNSLTPIYGLALLAAAVLAFIFLSKERRIQGTIFVLIAGIFIYNLRFGIDLLRFSAEHLNEYNHGTYDEAGSVYRLAAKVIATENGEINPLVYVCRNGTNFKEKLLRYLTYPVRVSSDDADASGATLVAVMNKYKWSFDTGKNGINELACGAVNRKAQKLDSFPDGSSLFKVSSLAPVND